MSTGGLGQSGLDEYWRIGQSWLDENWRVEIK